VSGDLEAFGVLFDHGETFVVPHELAVTSDALDELAASFDVVDFLVEILGAPYHTVTFDA
jgi:hypothetical protein